jgi:DNA-binding phage protein
MALTREFKNTVAARAHRDPRFREALFTEALNAYFSGDTAVGKTILRDLVNATIGFEKLASTLKKPSKSLHRMLAPRGNPSTENFFSIVRALQKKAHVKLHVTAKASRAIARTISQLVRGRDSLFIPTRHRKYRLH